MKRPTHKTNTGADGKNKKKGKGRHNMSDEERVAMHTAAASYAKNTDERPREGEAWKAFCSRRLRTLKQDSPEGKVYHIKIREELTKRYGDHLISQSNYMEMPQLSEYLVIIVDAMNQDKFAVPRHLSQDNAREWTTQNLTATQVKALEWTSSVKPVLQDGDLCVSALPHAAAAGSPIPNMESWRRTQQRVGWFITSHLKTLCPTPDLLRQRPFKIIDGTVQGHRIFTTRCVMGEAHPQSVEDNSAAQQSSPHDEPNKNLYLLTGHSHEAFDELFANSARLQRQSTLQPLRTCLGDASLVETSSAAPSPPPPPNLVETSNAAKQTSPRPSKRAKTNGAIDEAEAKDTTRQMLTEHCATCKIETYKRPATQTVEEFLEWTYSCVAETLPDVMGTQAKFLDPSMCDDAGAGAECGDDCTVSTERDATPSTTHDAKRVKKFLPPGTWAGMWRLYYAMESFRHRKPASFTTFMRCIHTKKWASLLAIRNKPNW